MPSTATYTPYESLLFFQSVAQHGADATALQNISAALNANQSVRDDATYDDKRLTASALQNLYEELTKNNAHSHNIGVNGYASGNDVNPRKRKISPPPSPRVQSADDDQRVIQQLVERLYSDLKGELVDNIVKDETEYEALQEEIREIQIAIEAEERDDGGKKTDSPAVALSSDAKSDAIPTIEAVPSQEQFQNTNESPRQDAPTTDAVDAKDPLITTSRSGSTPPKPASTEPLTFMPQHYIPPRLTATANSAPHRQVYTPRSSHHSPPVHYSEQAMQQSSPGAFQNRTLPPPSPQRANYGPIPPQPPMAHTSPHSMPLNPYVQGVSNVRQPGDPAGAQRRYPPGQGRGSPSQYPQPPPSYTAYPHPQMPWPPQGPHPGHPSQHGPFPGHQFYPPHPGGHAPPFQTPQPLPYQQYPISAQLDQFGKPQMGWQSSIPPPWFRPANSLASTPILKSHSGQTARTPPGSSTPWKKQQLQSDILRLPSPTRPDREVSPLTDRDSPDRQSPSTIDKRAVGRTKRRGRPREYETPLASESRSNSRATEASESRGAPGTTRGTRDAKVKKEPPSTPAPLGFEIENHKQSGRRGRAATGMSGVEAQALAAGQATKRKRSPPPETYSSPSIDAKASRRSRGRLATADSDLVAVSKTFSKSVKPMLAEISSHRVGAIFSKPLTEKEAPGYRQLVLRPQDLRSIGFAVNKGGRVAASIVDEDEQRDESGEASTPTKSVSLPAGFKFVNKTEDLVPPKGIVNSSQLEKELMRVFANAIMFNPLPSDERGFGPSLKLIRRAPDHDRGSPGAASDSSQSDDGNIIHDAREFFDFVVNSVNNYRDLEDERLGNAPSEAPPDSAVRGTSVSMSSALGEEGMNPPEEGEGGGISRKRRRLGDSDAGSSLH